MKQHSHEFVESYDGLVGYSYDRKTNEFTLAFYLQKFSDDEVIKVIADRMSDTEMERLFNLVSGLLKSHLTEEEYHRLFLKD
ncbi:MAG: cytoplasmic protein [Deltaproteobacteria bacterium]|nr:cytoplasmic protein [Deltaproteobacteria bacterium]